jgi:hypothetical protein
MTEEHGPIAADGVEDPGDAPQIHENGGDPLPDDPEDVATPPMPRTTRAAVPPAPTGR